MHKKIKEEIDAVLILFYFLFFAKYHSVNSTQHWKICYTTNDFRANRSGVETQIYKV